MPDFALWPRDGMHKPAFCVWELMPVWHENKSWERFLVSARDEAAARPRSSAKTHGYHESANARRKKPLNRCR